MMRYVKFNTIDELTKMASGKRTKIGVRILLFQALKHYPGLQKQIGETFGIRDTTPDE